VYYLFTRRFVLCSGQTPLQLLVVSHVLMGLFSAVLLLVLRPLWLPSWGDVALILAGSISYLAGQLALARVLRDESSSRITPLLGSKIIVLALLSALCLQQHLLPAQWLAVLLSAGAAWLLNESGGRMPATLLVLVSAAVLGYCLSDLSVGVILQQLPADGPPRGLLVAAMFYLMSGIVVLPFVFRREAHVGRIWALALPCALTWFAAMCLLCACFACIGVVFGNIVQATRGLIAVVLGWAVARIGFTHLEVHVSRRVFWRRIAGAVLMLLAVALYLCARA